MLLTLTVMMGAAAHAAETATSFDSAPAYLSPARGGLSRADAGRIYGGAIPDFAQYDAKMARDRSRCGYAWRTLRSADIPVRPVRASYDLIYAKAIQAGVPPHQLNRTLATFLKNQDAIPNQRYITVIDFNKRSNQRRFFTIDLTNGETKGYATSAGERSDPDGDGYATEFSNVRKKSSSLGCYVAYGTYSGGRFGRDNTMMLHGFEPTNDNACARSIIMHPRWYVGQVPGRSNGCFAFKPHDKDEVFGRVSGGLICAYHDGQGASAARRATRAERPRVSRAKRHHGLRRAPVRTARTLELWETTDDF